MTPRPERTIITNLRDEYRGFGFEATQFGIDGVQPLDPFHR